MRRAFEAASLALAGIHGFSDLERGEIVGLLKTARVRARPGDAGWVAALPGLDDRVFLWGEFDRWQEFFTARGTFPRRWEGLQIAPTVETAPEMRVAYRRRKLGLLLEWLDMLTRRAAELHHYTRQGRRVRIARQEDGQQCPVCAPSAAPEVGHNGDGMPPLHPGCRCVLMAAITAPRQRPVARRRDRSA